MAAAARPLLRAEPRGPRLVTDVAAGPRVRFRAWEADAAPTAPARPAAHAAVEIAWIDDGAVGYGIGSARWSIEASRAQAMIVPSEVEHATSFPAAMRGAAIWVDRDVVAEIGDAMGRREGPTPAAIVQGARVARLGAVLAEEVRAPDRGAVLAVDAIVEAIVVAALRTEPREHARPGRRAASPIDPAIAAAVRLLEECYAEPLGVEAMARAAHMSRFHFTRRFREATGRSPYRYLLDVRLERAAELLRRRRASVTEAAFSVGFSDPSRFARMFRARFGVVPSAYGA